MALYHSGIQFELREILLKEKPECMLIASSKGTVPVLIIDDNNFPDSVLDESLDIMHWSLKQTDPSNWLELENNLTQTQRDALIERNDTEFKHYLDKYKYFDRHPEATQNDYLEKALPFLKTLEELLSSTTFLGGSKPRMADIAIMPFVRQFCMTDQNKFNQLELPKLQAWLEHFLNNSIFTNVMKKHTVWQKGDETVYINQ